jgi:hypothetical protein
MAANNLNSVTAEEIRAQARQGLSVSKLARKFDISTSTIKRLLATATPTTPTASAVLEQMGVPDPTLTGNRDYNDPTPATLPRGQREPGHVNGRAEALGGHTINAATNPRGSNFQFTTTHRGPSAGFPDRSEPARPSTANGTTFDLFTGRSF